MNRAARRSLRAAAALAVVAWCAGRAPAAPDEKPPEARFAYVRDVADPADAVRKLVAAARARSAESVAFVLDRATFDPPPGVTQFNFGRDFVRDRRAWLDAFVAAAAAPGALRTSIALTTSPRLRAATTEDADAVEAECDGTCWIDRGKLPFRPAEEWIDAFGAALPGKGRAIVLVTGNVLSEHWVSVPFDVSKPRTREPWRSSLLPEGTAWREEEVAAAARRRGATLLIVAPEAKFGDEAPLDDRPEAPFATRPQVPSAAPKAEPKMRTAPRIDVARDEIVAELQRRGFDEAAIARALEIKVAESATPHDASDAGRFEAHMPTWFPLWGDQLPANTDCPSGYGWWPLVRAAAATGGALAFYPFRGSGGRWLDACVRDETLLDALAPPLGPREDFVADARRDAALSAMLAAQAAVVDLTPWTDYSKGYSTQRGGLAGWCAFELPGPVPAKRWERRRKPIDLEWELGGAKETATTLARVAEAYPRAIRLLAAAAEDRRVAAAPRRSQANLRLTRFWFEMSQFHLQALVLASREPQTFGGADAAAKDHSLASWNAVRMSDCLPSYDGRVLTAWEERLVGPKWRRGKNDPYQGNLLAFGTGHPDFRAERDVEKALANLDPRLRPQALAVVAAARDVMAHEARSPWGWVTYYSVLKTYAWDPPEKEPASGTAKSERQRGDSPGSTPGAATTPGTEK